MSHETSGIHPTSVLNAPGLSLATVRWRNDNDDGEMFAVVGEQYRLAAVNAAAEKIANEGSFLPARFWLTCDNDNQHDDKAVGVHAIVGAVAYHVGFLPKQQARDFRQSLADVDLDEQTAEVLGCITQGKTSHPNARLYLPLDFADRISDGYDRDPLNNPSWLQDAAPVTPRPYQGWGMRGFTDDDLKKIYCWYTRGKVWNSLPPACEEAAVEFRSYRGRVPDAMEKFILDPADSTAGIGDWTTADHSQDAKVFAKDLLREHLRKSVPPEEVEGRFKHTYIGCRPDSPTGQAYTVRWSRLNPSTILVCTIRLTRTGPLATDFRVDSIKFESGEG